MIFRFAIFALVITSLACCGCRSVGLSASEKQIITDFVQKQTGEPVLSIKNEADGDVLVETAGTGKGLGPTDLWLLKRGPDGWKLIKAGFITL